MHALRDDVEEVLLSEEQIQRRLDELAGEIEAAYAGKELTLVGVLTGSVVFIADLLRRLPGPLRLDYVGISSYRGTTRSTGELLITKALQLDVRDRCVLVVDDILDTGLTLVKVCAMLRGFGAREVRTCVFLEKTIPHHENFRADFVAFRIPNKFVAGYGLDYQERYRNLPYVATLKPAVLAASW
jgi:hypoxanthine phosphoribosyltransferase